MGVNWAAEQRPRLSPARVRERWVTFEKNGMELRSSDRIGFRNHKDFCRRAAAQYIVVVGFPRLADSPWAYFWRCSAAQISWNVFCGFGRRRPGGGQRERAESPLFPALRRDWPVQSSRQKIARCHSSRHRRSLFFPRRFLPTHKVVDGAKSGYCQY